MALRFGQYFLLIGVILCIVFYATYQSNMPDERYLGWGMLAGGLGLFLMFRYRRPAGGAVERFRALRGWRARQAQAKKDRDARRKAKEDAKKARQKK